MIKSVAFDLGGVVVSDWRDILFSYVENLTGVPRADVLKHFNHGSDEVHAGTLDPAIFWRGVLGPAADAHSDETLRGIFVKPYTVSVNEEVLAIAQELKKHYQVGVISNTLPEHTAYTRTHHPGFLETFDPIVLSWQVRITKPSKGIFEEYIRQSGHKPHEIAFIDDQEKVMPGSRISAPAAR